MSDTRFVDIGNPLDIRVTRQYLGKGVPELTVSLTIKRGSDNNYWDGSDWSSSISILTMDKISDTTNPGEHRYVGPTPLTVDVFDCHAYIESGKYAFDEYESLVSKKDISVADILSGSVEDKSVEYCLRCAMAMFNGNFSYDQNTKTITFLDRSGAPFSVVSVPDDDTRVRIS